MGGGPGGLHATALVNGHIHNHRPFFHGPEHIPGDQFRGIAARDQHRSHQQVGNGHLLFDIMLVGHQGRDPAGKDVFQVGQSVQIGIEHGDGGAQGGCHPGRIGAHGAAADNGYVAVLHPRHPAQQDAAAAFFPGKKMGAYLDGHPAGHFAHRCQQREIAVFQLNGFVTDGRDSLVDQRLG